MKHLKFKYLKRRLAKHFFPPAFLYDSDPRDSFGFDFAESF